MVHLCFDYFKINIKMYSILYIYRPKHKKHTKYNLKSGGGGGGGKKK
jgi:hypothetical protein